MPMDVNQSHLTDASQMSFWEMFGVLWRGKWVIMAATMVLGALAGLDARLTTKTYRAAVLLSPVTNSGSGQLGAAGAAVSEFGGLASLAGLSIGGDSRKAEAVAVLQSEALTEKYMSDNNLLPVLFKDKWDAQRGTWKSTDPKKIPTLWKANELFKRQVRIVTTENKTGLVTLQITWTDAKTAAKWANDLVGLTNDYLRGKATTEAERSINFLYEQAAKTNIVEARQAIFKSLEVEINKSTLAQGTHEYAFRVLDPAVPPERPYSPQFIIWVASGALAGLILSGSMVLSRAGSRSRVTAAPKAA